MWGFLRNLVETVVEAVQDTVEAVVNWFVSLVVALVDVVVHLLRALGARFTLDFARAAAELAAAGRALWEFALNVTLGLLGMILQVLAIAVGLVQQLFGIEPAGRPLNPTEIGYLTPIFGESLNYGRITIIDGNTGVFTVSGGITIGNTVRISATIAASPVTNPMSHGFLVHEIVHVWQYQNGGARYISQALIAQLFSGATGVWFNYPLSTFPATAADTGPADTGYSFETALGGGAQWDGLNTEQQATLIDSAFAMDMDFSAPDTFNFIFPPGAGGADYSAQLQFAAGLILQGRGVAIWPPVSLPIPP